MKRDAMAGSLSELLLARVVDDRDAPAIVVPAASRWPGPRERAAGDFSWGDLVASALRLAERFEGAGRAPGDRLVQIGPHSADSVVIDLACLLSGIVHVLLHHDDGPAAHAEQIGWLEPKAVAVTGPVSLTVMPRRAAAGSFVGRTFDFRGQPLLSRGRPDGIADEVAKRVERCRPENCSTILLSSGTSGHPHGVAHSQRSLLANAVASSAVFLDDERDVRLSWLPMSHALPRTGDLYTAVVRGACLAIVEDRRKLLDACREAKPAAILGVPAMFERLEAAVRRGAIGDLASAVGGRVRVCVSGGAPLRERTIDAFQAAGVPIVQGYGLAEAGPVVTLASPRTARTGTVGLPLEGVELRTDADGQLLVRTPGRCLGVLLPSRDAGSGAGGRRAAEYVPHDPDSFLATGDLASIDPDGHARITGRCVDAIVLSGGEKVPPAEVERVIAEDPLVAQVCVVGGGLRRPLAIVVPEPAAVREAIRRMGLRVFSRRGAVRHPKLLAWIARRIEARQRRLPAAWRASAMLLASRPLDAAHGEATVSLKLKRPAIAEHFSFAIEAAASGHGCLGMTSIPHDREANAVAMERCIASMLFSPSSSGGFGAAAAAAAGPLRSRVARVVEESVAAREELRADGRIFEQEGAAAGRFSREAERRLGGIGLWGLTVSESHGGAGGGVVELVRAVSRLASVSPTAAGILSVHASIGAVSAVEAFGNALQREHWLPKLARGEPLSIFGATEPDAGCDLGRVAARLERLPDRPGRLVLSGQKMFITNATHGRLVKLLAKLDGKPAVVLVRLPETDTESFRLEPSRIHPLKHAHNATLVFDRFEVEEADLLAAPAGDGMAVVWHGLNRGRVTLAAQAAGTQRIMLSHALSYARERETWGRPIATRQLVQGRLARIAMGIVAAESLAVWAATAVDAGGGELEAITAKIVAGDCVRDSAIAALGIHAGRSFLVGHPLGDAIHDHLAVGIYEGESELLGLALFKGLAKRHPLAAAARVSDIRRAAAWLAWRASRWAARPPAFGSVLDGELRSHASAARRLLDRTAVEIDRAIRRHGRKLAEEQLLMAELSRRVRAAVAVMAVAHHVDRDPLGEHGPCGEARWRMLAAQAFCRSSLSRGMLSPAMVRGDAGRGAAEIALAAEARLGSAIVG